MIPLSVPYLNGNEWKYIKECLDTNWVSSAGKYVDLFEQKITEYTGARYAVACVNGTAALQVSLRIAGVMPDDEVIAPTLTFIAPINAIAYNGASPVFMDADNFYNINARNTIRFILEETQFREGFTFNKTSGNRISAIVPVHVWGNACWLDELEEVCKERNIAIVEDASESLGTRYIKGKFAGKHTGTIGKLGCISFNGNKIITTGGGGIILTDDEDLATKARYLTTQAKDDEEKYIHKEIGYNFRLTNIQAALGVAQLEQLDGFIARKKEIFNTYVSALDNNYNLSIAYVPDYANNNHWLTVLKANNKSNRENIFGVLSHNSVQTRPVWYLNHQQKPFADCEKYNIVNAIKLLDKSLCLPSSVNLEQEEVESIINFLNE